MFTYDFDHTYVIMIGASAAISGLIGAYILLYPGSSMCYCFCIQLVCRCLRVPASIYLVLWFVFQFIYSLFTTQVAVWAHIGGFFMGILLAYILTPRNRIQELRKKMFIENKYRGISPVREELTRHSLRPIMRAVIVLSSIILILTPLIALPLAAQYEGKYYNIYDIERVKYMIYYNPGPIGFSETTYSKTSVEKIFFKIEDSPPSFKEKILEKSVSSSTPIFYDFEEEVTVRKLVSLKSIKISYLTESIAVLLVIDILIVIVLAIILITNRYRGIEVTYLPESLRELKHSNEFQEGRKNSSL